MPEETSPLPKSIPPPVVESTPSGASADARALNDLRKEVVEARNLVIKTDNLLKNMHAELKKFSVQQDEFRKSRMWSSAGAYGLFALICVLGAVFFAQSQGSHEREAAKAAEERARLEVQKAEVAQKQLKDKADASERALHIYDSLSSEKEGSGLTAAIANAARYERKQLSTLESKAIDDKLMLLRERLSSAALEKGQSAFRRGD
ncbi:MAG: hypothetical protein JST92_25925, partial [Deltaproteobacteria bacterium]|nr:hypothetical protein [Deltaproteobacteria bacterium]